MEIHHIGYAVYDINSAAQRAKHLGYKQEGEIIIDHVRNIKILFVIKDGVRLEFIAPNGTPNSVEVYLKTLGPLPYHIGYLTDDLDGEIIAFQAQGWKVIQPPAQAVAMGGVHVAFLFQKDLGVIELIERIPQVLKTAYSQVVKRILDITFSVILLVILFPLIVMICLCELCFCGPPVFYCSKRPGKGGQLFTIYKFRTMVPPKGDPKDYTEQSRITPLGHFLRKTSLDELPQLWNILRGDMSFIGPRPIPIKSIDLYSPRHRQRLGVRPGLACFRVSSKDETGSWTYREQFENDLKYIQNISFWYDCKMLIAIIRHTFSDTFVRENSLRPEFDGTNLDWKV